MSRSCHRLAANVNGLALLGDLKIVRPVLLPNRIAADEINNKKLNIYSSAGTEDAMLLKMKLQGHAPITPNPCNVQADLSNEMVLIVSRGFGSVCKQHSFTKVCCRVLACVPL